MLTYPGARRPDAAWRVNANGVDLAAYRWGADTDPPLLLAHGGFDFAGTMDGLAARLADAGWQVISWDQRGHGDSEHAALYSFDADVRDSIAVLDSVTADSVPVIGHSKGGGLMMSLANLRPDRVTALVNLDGLPSHKTRPDVNDRERTRLMAAEMSARLDARRRAHDNVRKPGTIDELADRRARMNPRLDPVWLRYLVPIGAAERDDGWRWKLDPSMRFGGFGPYRPEWSLQRLPGLAVPFMAVLGLELEEMGWGTEPGDVEDWFPPQTEFHALEGVGHFVHIEQPDHITELIVEFLA